MEGKNTQMRREQGVSNFRVGIESPTYEDFNSCDFEEFKKKFIPLWRENHQKLLQIIKSGDFPFFGLHGTDRTNLKKIQEEKKGYLYLVTFDKKEKTEKFLYKLYGGMMYSLAYTKPKYGHGEEGRGGIMVFNLREVNGINLSTSSSYLNAGATLNIACDLNFDSEHERELFKWVLDNLDHEERRLNYGDLKFPRASFDERFNGVVDTNDLQKYLTPLNIQDDTGFARDVVRNRFLAQEILARTLELLKSKKNIL